MNPEQLIENVFYIIENVFYVFGSWLVVHLSYIFGYAVAIDGEAPTKRWKTLAFIISKIVSTFGVIFMVGSLGLGEDFIIKVFTLGGFIQIFIVTTIPATFGIWKALKQNREIARKRQEYELKHPDND
jgi:hypothetical protein